jgi:hypothetical protein
MTVKATSLEYLQVVNPDCRYVVDPGVDNRGSTTSNNFDVPSNSSTFVLVYDRNLRMCLVKVVF